MIDLTKLTRDQIGATEWVEIRRRLARLKKCEAALNKYYKGHNTRLAGGCHCDSCDAARAALEE